MEQLEEEEQTKAGGAQRVENPGIGCSRGPRGRLAAAGVTSVGFSFLPWLQGPGPSPGRLVAAPTGGGPGCTASWAHRWKGDQMVMMFTIIIREDTSELSFINCVTPEEYVAQMPVTVSGAMQVEC